MTAQSMTAQSMTVNIIASAGLPTVIPYVGLPVGRPAREDDREIASLRRLALAGDEHAKLMRMVMVWFDIRAPLYWWKQFVTYRIGVETYSESTMHTLMDGVSGDDFTVNTYASAVEAVVRAIKQGDFVGAKASLPEGFLQRRLVMVSYQTLRRIYLQRQHHRLREWHIFINELYSLPFARELIFCKKET